MSGDAFDLGGGHVPQGNASAALKRSRDADTPGYRQQVTLFNLLAPVDKAELLFRMTDSLARHIQNLRTGLDELNANLNALRGEVAKLTPPANAPTTH